MGRRSKAMVAKFQQTAMRLRYSLVPTVCAGARHGARRLVRVHHALRPRTVAALESYIGLRRGGRRACCRRAAAARSSRCARPRRCGAAPVGSQARRASRSSARISRRSRWRRSRRARSRRRSWASCAPSDVVVMQRARSAARRHGAGARAGRCGLPAAAARAQYPGRRQDRHRDAAR